MKKTEFLDPAIHPFAERGMNSPARQKMAQSEPKMAQSEPKWGKNGAGMSQSEPIRHPTSFHSCNPRKSVNTSFSPRFLDAIYCLQLNLLSLLEIQNRRKTVKLPLCPATCINKLAIPPYVVVQWSAF
jgi:hypothetical protein